MTTPPTLSEMRHALDVGSIQHAETETIQDVLNQMTPEQKDLQATIVGAALENTNLSGNPEIVDSYNELSVEHKLIIDYIVGNLLAEDSVLEHDAMWYSESLAHYGVKGMKWGVIRDTARGGGAKRLSASPNNTAAGRAAARNAVDRGKASVKQTHLAALKSNGHRAINALSGDKTFWRRMAITAGITTTVLAAPVAAAWLLPTGVLTAIGGTAAAAALGTPTMSALEAGQWALGSVAVYGSAGALAVGTVGNVVGNTARAVAGNSLINKSYASVGKELASRQKSGRERVKNVLKGAAGIRDKDLLKHDDVTPPTLSEMMHILENGDSLEHFGIKGMKWGVRRTDAQLARIRNDEGEDVGGIKARTKKDAQRLRSMRTGSAVVIDTDDGPQVVVKQKDGAFKEVRISADAEAAIRTLNKDPAEMSTREMNDAVKRAQAIEQYNKFFNQREDPNAEMAAKLAAMDLQMKYANLHSQMNPSRTTKAVSFISSLSPAFDTFQKVDKLSGGTFSTAAGELLNQATGTKGGKHKAVKTPKAKKAKP